MKISTTRKEASFYIARVGSKAGMPMWENYTANNAFSVDSDNPERDYQVALHLYRSGQLRAYTVGTCQPSIRKRDIIRLIENHIVSNNILKKMAEIDKLIRLKEDELAKLKELQMAITRYK
tara:strand:+ start:203 stop:565 length:363 start_codon:yes stop_codon:yes gene_type:complete